MTADPRLWDDAACADSDVAVFFPHDLGQVAVRRAHAVAVAICDRCPHVTECLAYALEHDERHGVWGATTPRQRSNMRDPLPHGGSRKQPIEHGTNRGYSAHKYRGETPCDLCRRAANVHHQGWRERNVS